ncbi:glycosyltransferase [Geobacter argillaceus]|uniref:GT2 family glycosyltransferase n=1 Tax=Geobacter argillaceus TaxID=345631 RepID=A0A562VLM5_9BACT|nr:glycosyltransferase [Geobacter argillaceus]TWJ18866.1 GT2 family glycosyltransferase [Geobacter argillaceus]
MNTAVIIVTYNSSPTIAPCLASVLASRQPGDELVVVDNASRDSTPAVLHSLAELLPADHLTVITNTTNRGFSAAVNQGIHASRAPLVVLLNPDAVVSEGWQLRLAAHLDNPRVAAVGPVSNFAAGRQSVDCHWLGEPPENVGVQAAADRLYASNAGRHETALLLIGFCLLLRRDLLDELGGPDERLFLGNDDLELSWRLRLHGYELRIASDCFVYHEGQHSFRSDPGSVTEQLLCESSDALYSILEEHYGAGRVPTPSELWGIDWFAPTTPNFNPSVRFDQVLTLPTAASSPSPENSPLVSIIILTFNQCHYTEECLAALERYTPEPHEVVLVDNGSDDGTVVLLRELVKTDSRYRLIENKDNRGFAAGCNQGLAAASGTYLVLLNNDVLVTPGWLSGLLECHHAEPAAGIIGPLTNNASGIQGLGTQDYGSAGLDGYARLFRQHNRHRRVPSRRLVGFCMLFSRQLYREVGSLDERFGTGNYEDDDFCLRAAIVGYRNLIAGDVYLHHYGGITFAAAGIDYRRAIGDNWLLFREKWSAPVNDPAWAAKITRCRLREDVERLMLAGQSAMVAQRVADDGGAVAEDPLLRELYAMSLWAASRSVETGDLFPPGGAASLTLQGRAALDAGNMMEAERLLWAAVSADPGFGGPYPWLALLACQRGERAYASELLLKGILLSPTLSDYEGIIEQVLSPDRVGELVKILLSAHRLYPDSRLVSRLLVVWTARVGLHEEVVTAAEHFCARFGPDEEVLTAGLSARRELGLHSSPAPVGKRVSLCMIVRDEERRLPDCLLSCRPLVQEMIVVDTGSEDHSSQLAELFGAKLLSYQWCDDFSAARNASLSAAQGDWILVMDADELISVRDYAQFRTFLMESPPCGSVMTTRNYTNATNMEGFQPLDGGYPEEEAGLGWTGSDKVRLFPNRSDIRFEGVVHETVDAAAVRAGLSLRPHPTPVHHYGALDGGRRSRKQHLYYLLGKRKLEQARDVRAIYELAVQAGELGLFNEAESLWREFLEQEPERSVAWFNLGYLLLQQGQMQEAAEATGRALALRPDYPAALSNLGVCVFCLSSQNDAAAVLDEMASRCPDDLVLRLLSVLARYLGGESVGECVEALLALNLQTEQLAGFMARLESALLKQGRSGDAASVREFLLRISQPS